MLMQTPTVAYQDRNRKKIPVIEYYEVVVLGTVNVADYVKAHDYNGQELAVKLLKFCDRDGNRRQTRWIRHRNVVFIWKIFFAVKAVDAVIGKQP